MNDFESMAFTFPPSVPIFSDVFGSELSNEDNVMNANDVELHGILDDIGFFEADDEESMLLPTSEIVQTDIMFVASNGDSARVSPLVTKSSLIESVGALSSPAFVSSHDLVVSEQQNESSWKTIPVTVSSSSVASKVAPLKPLSLPNYYLATNKFSMTTNTNIPLAPIPVSPTMSGRPRIAVTGVTSAPATAALAALAAKPTACEANTSKKRRLSDIQSDSWVSEEDVEIRRYVGMAFDRITGNILFLYFCVGNSRFYFSYCFSFSVNEIEYMLKRAVNAKSASLIPWKTPFKR